MTMGVEVLLRVVPREVFSGSRVETAILVKIQDRWPPAGRRGGSSALRQEVESEWAEFARRATARGVPLAAVAGSSEARALEKYRRWFAASERVRLPRRTGRQWLSLGKDWREIGFLLTGRHELRPRSRGADPLGAAVFGGVVTRAPSTYGRARIHVPASVCEVADSFGNMDWRAMRGRCEREWAEPAYRTYLLRAVRRVASFYKRAAQHRDGVLISFE